MFIGLVGWAAPQIDPDPRGSGLFLFGLAASIASSVVVHELAHFLCARWVGLNPWCLSIGHGVLVFERRFASFRLTLRAFPYSGAVFPFAVPDPDRPTRWRELLMVAAGPFSNALLLVTSVLVVFLLGLPGLPGWTRFFWEMLVANAYLLIVGLVPYWTRLDGIRIPTDGLRLIQLLLPRLSTQQAIELSSSTPQGGSPSPDWNWLVRHVDPAPVLTAYRNCLERSDLPAEHRALMLDAFATCVLMYGAEAFLAEADRYSAELLELKPTEWTVKGTRGSVLVEKGDIEAGVAMLTQVMERDPSPFDRAICASFLALAELKRRNRTLASKWLDTSRGLDPNCASLLRIEPLLRSSPAPPHPSTI